ncbi:HD domain-containing protein [Nitrogeniibacter mangrovi]|uniref:HD domain-containing protein n=1 Tax=Nitrogeniibacter mangrovi TaxID=2016596 RepID=A0A6C1B4W2_9RHOO|nr:HD domain-containing phosphohydrolase [Nitrogeniibacter mangrovi]QID18746.1 HD domain-containing protein [Nitrogeniibacter mangrovi]
MTMDARRLSPIDHIDHVLLDTFIQKSLPGILAPLQRTLAARLPHPCQLQVLWLAPDRAEITARIDPAGHRNAHAPCPVDDSPTLRHGIEQGKAVHQPSLDDPLMAWAGGDECQPLVCFPLRHGQHCIGFLLVMHHMGKPPSDPAQAELLAWLPMMATLLMHEIDAIHGLFGAVRFARDFALMRDTETGQHQLRLGGYVDLLASAMSQAHGLADGFAQEVALYAPLHDIGKIGIPDEILLKPGAFDAEERERMKAHVTNGTALIDRLIEDFGLANNPRIDVLRSVVAWHHEYLDGSGYPEGLSGDAIPLATRIITVADIFDALTNLRAYKKPWSIDEAFDLLRKMAGKQLDRECVQAFISERKRITGIWEHYAAHGA